jgi:homoserine kinase
VHPRRAHRLRPTHFPQLTYIVLQPKHTVSITVRVPATTANIGPGFDCLGAALTLYNEFTFTSAASLQIDVTGTGAATIAIQSPSENLLYVAFAKLFEHIGQPVLPVHITIQMNVPLARGLGSSATAIVGGLVGANELAGKPLSLDQIAALATEMEGHPDNVVPALLGGCRLAAAGIDRAWEIAALVWQPQIVPVVAIPDFELSTQAARSVLPQEYSRADAVFNAAHVGLLLQGLATGNGDWLQAALQDRIHQPYRQTLIRGYEQVQAAAIGAGAYGMVISGAGPTLLALVDESRAAAVREAMENAWRDVGVNAGGMVLGLDQVGAVVS